MNWLAKAVGELQEDVELLKRPKVWNISAPAFVPQLRLTDFLPPPRDFYDVAAEEFKGPGLNAEPDLQAEPGQRAEPDRCAELRLPAVPDLRAGPGPASSSLWEFGCAHREA